MCRCAVGASYERERHGDLPTPLNDFFAQRAKALLEPDLANPRLSTVQALAILSTHEGAAARDTRGWLYSGKLIHDIRCQTRTADLTMLSGMAVRLAYDLGLHIDTQMYVVRGTMSAEEARARKIAFWGTFATDRMWGFYLGRPFHNNLKDITVERPSMHDGNCLDQTWVPYGTPGRDHGALPNSQALLTERWISLYEIMSNLGHSLYGCFIYPWCLP